LTICIVFVILHDDGHHSEAIAIFVVRPARQAAQRVTKTMAQQPADATTAPAAP
jgi:hypothetical protein